MSTQSILEISRERYREEAEETLLQFSDKYFYDKHFKLGCGIDRDKILHYMIIDRSLCTNNCELINYVEDKIAGRLEDTVRKSRQTRLQELIQKLAKQNKQIEDEIEQKVFWSDTQW